MDRVRSWDLFKLAPTKLSEQTVMGSLLTLLVVTISIYFIFHEVDSMSSSRVTSELQFADLKVTLASKIDARSTNFIRYRYA